MAAAARRESTMSSDSHGPQTSTMAIAIVGIGCRLPGGANNPTLLWEMLSRGLNSWSQGPGLRFNSEKLSYDSNPASANGCSQQCGEKSMGGHFLTEDVSSFDREFFNLSADEAKAMNPHTRKLLEVAFDTFESAGFTKDRLSGSETGVYISQLRDELDNGTTPNRVSYHFNLKGPSVTVDDGGCSSPSLVALHQAIQSLRRGETEQCFVGGVSLLLDPSRFSSAGGRKRSVSLGGRSYTYKHRGMRYGLSEGIVGVLIKPLDVAIRDGNPIRAIIPDAVVLSGPSVTAQEEAIEMAYSSDAGYVEMLGRISDPIEIKAITSTLAVNCNKSEQLLVGSVTTNIGYCEPVAGIASLIKAVLMLENMAIPPHTNGNKSSPSIPVDRLGLMVSQSLQSDVNLNRVLINSFGYGGRNAHVVVEKAPPQPPYRNGGGFEKQMHDHLFVISGKTEKACRNIAANLIEYLVEKLQPNQTEEDDEVVRNLACTLAQRSALKYRVAFVAKNLDSLVTQLELIQEGTLEPQVSLPSARLAYVFSGHGAQWHGMARELLQTPSAFRRCIEAAAEHLRGLGCSWNLVDELLQTTDHGRIHRADIAQPLCTAIQLGMVDQLKALGVKSDVVVGHSGGEVAASYAAGILSLEDAMSVAYHRGRLCEQHRSYSKVKGAMLAVGRSSHQTLEFIRKIPGGTAKLEIACLNGPESVTVSGDEVTIEQLHQKLQAEHVFSRILETNGLAYHSRQLEPVVCACMDALAHIKPRVPHSGVRMISCVTGQDVGTNLLDANYWATSVVDPVLFSPALEKICPDVDTMVEIGPHSALAGSIKQILKCAGGEGKDITYASALIRNENACRTVMDLAGTLFTRGLHIDLKTTNSLAGEIKTRLLTDLPNYPWDHDHDLDKSNKGGNALSKPNAPDVGKSLKSATSLFEATSIAKTAILEEVSRLLSVSSATLDPTQTLLGCGVDSFVAVELHHWIAVKLKANVSLLEMLKDMSIIALGATVVERSKLVSVAG